MLERFKRKKRKKEKSTLTNQKNLFFPGYFHSGHGLGKIVRFDRNTGKGMYF